MTTRDPNDPDRARSLVAVILALVVGAGVLMLTASALIDVLADPAQATISAEYAALVQTTLGVLVGGLVGYLGGTATSRRPPPGDPPDTPKGTRGA